MTTFADGPIQDNPGCMAAGCDENGKLEHNSI